MTVIDHIYPTHNEFRSDTFTVPTMSMIEKAAKITTYGDSVYKEDEITLELEHQMCELSGKESALFCVSGTMSNQIGLRANLYQPPYSILCDHRSHVFLHEAGGLATLSQAMVHPVIPSNGNYITLEDIIENFTPDNGDIHAAPTKVISLENTLHGIILPLEEIKKISAFAKSQNIRLHLDGARLWNASAETGIPIKEYCSYFDSVSLCLSKSLGAPMGSILVGDKQFIDKANHFKKQNGGGIRQAGIVTSMALVAIEENFPKLKKSHEYAKNVGDFCVSKGIKLESPVNTNFVFIDFKAMKMNEDLFIKKGQLNNIKLMGNRLAFTFQNDSESIEILKKVILDCYEDSLINPYEAVSSNKKLYNIVTK
ncbi:low specificity L-threonine aldolase [[Candida] jaroonii]|uniref:Low specificity L-threonine aldolase n=1 Tax=[Candida] jaroonii TaxID=467808 RepID=A0ACA9YBJ4_9ASCO|nr:low specificity L-threonine aldolase [[Candida] jaroonii]